MFRALAPSLVLSSLMCAGCWIQPVGLYDQSRPLPPVVQSAGRVEAEHCTPYLLHFIPLSTPEGMSELVEQATGGGLGLVNVAVDTRGIYWIIGHTVCHRLTAERVIAAAPGAPVGLTDQEAQELASITRDVLPVLYKSVELEPPADPAHLLRDARAVKILLDAGLSFPDVMLRARRGAEAEPAPVSLVEMLR